MRAMTHLGWPMHSVAQDLRYAFRMLWKSPMVTIVAVLTLAIGVGATTAVFSVVNASLLRPMPYYQPQRLQFLWGNTVRAGAVERRGASYPDFRDWRDQSKSFEGMALFGSNGFTLVDKDGPERLTGEQVSATYFDLLGVRLQHGRGFAPREDAPTGGSLVAVISNGLWQRRFGGDPSILGRTMQLDSKTYSVIGVAPRGFTGLTDTADVWVPTGSLTDHDLGGRGSRGWQVVGRTRAGVTVEQAQAELTNICRQLARQYPDTNDQRGVEVIGLQQDTFAPIRKPVLVTFGSVLLVFLIACVNISNLLLARAECRQREVAIRFAMGATRSRVLRQLLIESAVLAVFGCGLGLCVGIWAVQGLLALSPIQLPSFVSVGMDGTVLAFTVGTGVATALLVGLLPGFHLWHRELNSLLNSAAGRTGHISMRDSVRGFLVVTEVALAMILLIGAGLLIRSFQRLTAFDPGFDPEGVVTMQMQIGPNDSNVKTANRELALLDRLKGVPGISSVSFSSDVPLDGNSSAVFYTPEGNSTVTEQKRPRAYVHRVSPDFFSTLRIGMKQGRTFSPAEMSSDAKLVIVGEDVVKRYWPGENPIGKRLKMGGPTSQNPWFEVVGVVADIKYRALPRNPTPDPDIFFPLHERSEVFSLTARTQTDPGQMGTALRAAIKEFDASIPIYNITAMRNLVDGQLSASRFAGSVMGLFAIIALLLALIGTYSVMSYVVSQSTQEIAIRMALGAQREQIFRRVVGRGFVFALAGTGIGIILSLILRRALSGLLFGVSSTNPVVIGSVMLLMLACTVFACYVPARRATRVDPMVALRSE